jgi:hypothetical protein
VADLCRVFAVGNFDRDIERRLRPDGTITGRTMLCIGRTALVGGVVQNETTRIPVEVLGAVRVSSVAQQFGAGSRVLIEGHLELRETSGSEPCQGAKGAGELLVHVPHSELVLVIETVFNAATPLPAPEAERQPTSITWEE